MDARDELPHLERLGHVVAGSSVETLHARIDVASCGENQHRKVVVMQAGGNVQAVHVGKTKIEDHEIRGVPNHFRKAFCTESNGGDVEVSFAKLLDEKVSEGDVVLHDQ